jgi:hypothetical protein
LVFKRSFDGGETWTPLQILYTNSTHDDWVVIGNSAVVQDRNTGKILVPFCRNNLQVTLPFLRPLNPKLNKPCRFFSLRAPTMV